MKKLLATLTLAALCFAGFGQDDMPTGIIYGPSLAYSLTAPKGWTLDNKAGVNQGLYAVFYKDGESWNKAETVMYSNSASLEKKVHSTLEQLINFDLERFKRNYLDIQITDQADIVIGDSIKAVVKHLEGESYGNFEDIAYIDAHKSGVMIVLSSRTKEGYESNKSNFIKLVKSYTFISNDVKAGKKK